MVGAVRPRSRGRADRHHPTGEPADGLTPWGPDDDERPAGRRRHLLELAGVLEGVLPDEDVDEMVEQVYADRCRARDRNVPREWF